MNKTYQELSEILASSKDDKVPSLGKKEEWDIDESNSIKNKQDKQIHWENSLNKIIAEQNIKAYQFLHNFFTDYLKRINDNKIHTTMNYNLPELQITRNNLLEQLTNIDNNYSPSYETDAVRNEVIQQLAEIDNLLQGGDYPQTRSFGYAPAPHVVPHNPSYPNWASTPNPNLGSYNNYQPNHLGNTHPNYPNYNQYPNHNPYQPNVNHFSNNKEESDSERRNIVGIFNLVLGNIGRCQSKISYWDNQLEMLSPRWLNPFSYDDAQKEKESEQRALDGFTKRKAELLSEHPWLSAYLPSTGGGAYPPRRSLGFTPYIAPRPQFPSFPQNRPAPTFHQPFTAPIQRPNIGSYPSNYQQSQLPHPTINPQPNIHPNTSPYNPQVSQPHPQQPNTTPNISNPYHPNSLNHNQFSSNYQLPHLGYQNHPNQLFGGVQHYKKPDFSSPEMHFSQSSGNYTARRWVDGTPRGDEISITKEQYYMGSQDLYHDVRTSRDYRYSGSFGKGTWNEVDSNGNLYNVALDKNGNFYNPSPSAPFSASQANVSVKDPVAEAKGDIERMRRNDPYNYSNGVYTYPPIVRTLDKP